MDLLKGILRQILAEEDVHITFPELSADLEGILQSECCKTLTKIKAVLEDNSLDDAACFARIEEIVCIFENIGCHCGGRHDF